LPLTAPGFLPENTGHFAAETYRSKLQASSTRQQTEATGQFFKTFISVSQITVFSRKQPKKERKERGEAASLFAAITILPGLLSRQNGRQTLKLKMKLKLNMKLI
jgi:cytoskeletal protein RodZ